MISLKEVVEIMNSKDASGFPTSFDISFFTLNRQSKKGGNLKTYTNCRLLAASPKSNKQINHKYLLEQQTKSKKKANHFKNRTRNLELENGQIKKIHIHLIDTFNGKKMTL